MTLRAMEVFLAVVDTGSMRAAAETLYISQPSVSGVIADLEKEYGVRLFERLGKKLYITPEGDPGGLCAADALPARGGRPPHGEPCGRHAAAHRRDGDGGRLRHRGPPAPPARPARARPVQQHARHRAAAVDQPAGRGARGRARAQPRPAGHARDPRLPSAHLPAGQRLCRPGGRAPGGDRRRALLLRERGSDTRAALDRVFEERGLRAQVAWECNNTQAILNAVRQGFGVALLSPCLLRGQGEGLAAVPVSDCDFTRWFSVAVHRDKFIGERLRAFLDLCAQWQPEDP